MSTQSFEWLEIHASTDVKAPRHMACTVWPMPHGMLYDTDITHQ
jgi:hypothetical protein